MKSLADGTKRYIQCSRSCEVATLWEAISIGGRVKPGKRSSMIATGGSYGYQVHN